MDPQINNNIIKIIMKISIEVKKDNNINNG